MISFLSKPVLTSAAIALALTALAPLSLAQESSAQTFDRLRAEAASAGTPIYRGTTFALQGADQPPLFRYQRHVQTTDSALIASHVTHDPAANAVIVEKATTSLDYALQKFETASQQTGFSGSVQVSDAGKLLQFEVNDNGKISRASEQISAPAIAGPSMFGFIFHNWDALLGGTVFPVRVVVMKEKTSYGFDLKLEKLADGQATFALTPSSMLVRMAISPLRVVMDANKRTVVRYTGRVPPMQSVAGKLKDLDARVEYTSTAPSYR